MAFGADAISPTLNNLVSQAQQGINQFGQAVQGALPTGENGIISLLQENNRLLSRLVKVLAPPEKMVQIPFANLAPGSVVPQQNCNMNNAEFNAICASVTGNGAQVNIYLNPANPLTDPPDYVFLSGYSSATVFIPATNVGTVTIASVGTGAASGKVWLMTY